LNIAVCDDEKIFRDEIVDAIYDYFGKLDTNCFMYENGKQLLDAFDEGKEFDAYFLDIEMPGLDGMQTANELRNKGIQNPIVFLTSHTELALEGYEVSAFRFLAKPIQSDKMLKMLFDLKGEICEKAKYIIRYEGEDVILVLDDILYVQAMNNSVSIVMKDNEYTIRKKIADVEKNLAELSDNFVRVHRGYIVNLYHVKKYHGNDIIVTGDELIPLSRTHANGFKDKMFNYVRNSSR